MLGDAKQPGPKLTPLGHPSASGQMGAYLDFAAVGTGTNPGLTLTSQQPRSGATGSTQNRVPSAASSKGSSKGGLPRQLPPVAMGKGPRKGLTANRNAGIKPPLATIGKSPLPGVGIQGGTTTQQKSSKR